MSSVSAEPTSESTQMPLFLVQCAWCGAIKRGSSYAADRLPILPRLEGRRVSHGICPHCFDNALAARSGADGISRL